MHGIFNKYINDSNNYIIKWKLKHIKYLRIKSKQKKDIQ